MYPRNGFWIGVKSQANRNDLRLVFDGGAAALADKKRCHRNGL